VGGAAAWFFAIRSSSTPAAVARVDLKLPSNVELSTGGAQNIAVSRDGSRIAFLGIEAGARQLYLRQLDLDKSETTIKLPIPQIHTLSSLAFDPDGRTLAFTANDGGGSLETISIADRLVVPLVQGGVTANDGVTWGVDGNITYVSKNVLWQIPSKGGLPTQVTTLDSNKGELKHVSPVAIGDGGQVLFTVLTGTDRDAAHIQALTLRSRQRKKIVDRAKAPLLTWTGHLLFFRDDSIVAVRFDADRQVVSGPFHGVLDDVAVDSSGRPLLAISETGTLVYASRLTSTSQLVWSSRTGQEETVMPEFGMFRNPRVVSSDGGKVLVRLDGNLWVKDLTTRAFPTLTSNSTSGNDYPALTPDGTRVVFHTDTGLVWRATDGSGRAQPIAGTSSNDYPGSVAPDNSTLAFQRYMDKTSADIYALSLDGDSNVRAIVQENAFEGGPEISPDGKWLAYVSGRDGPLQIYVRRFPDGKDTPVSVNGGTQPQWNRNSQEIFYREGDKMMAVRIQSTNPELRLSTPRTLFERKYDFGGGASIPNYDVSQDGRFLMLKPRSDSGQLTLVLNWTEELKRLVAAK
jgi:Tol biopolymer transport system component